MATIEPRLIHLLNESTTPQLAHTDLPSIHALHLPTSLDRPLSQVESDLSYRSDILTSEGHNLIGREVLQGVDDVAAGSRRRERNRDGHYAATAAIHPLQLLLSETTPETTQFSKAADEPLEGLEDASYRKRSRTLTTKDDFVQLPQPVKKQKASDKTLRVPPIIKPLLEPPPHAALFPPIASRSFVEKQNDNAIPIKTVAELSSPGDAKDSQGHSSDADAASNRKGKRVTKPRRKWTEDETKHLLLGVHKHGVGKWTSILEDQEFKFNDRTAGDLKDRFRTCCPDELRGSGKDTPNKIYSRPAPRVRQNGHTQEPCTKSPDEDQRLVERQTVFTACDSDACTKVKKSRAHRKNLDDLAELGIHGPFKKSHRRERRPFTDQDDREILDGLEQYGPAWTKIQRDPRFNLSTRQPTDLRDRVRNKYPVIYQRIEKGSLPTRDGSRGNDTLEPSVNMAIDNSFERSKTGTQDGSVHQSSSREDFLKIPTATSELSESAPSSQAMELGEAVTSQFINGEMDLPRIEDTRQFA